MSYSKAVARVTPVLAALLLSLASAPVPLLAYPASDFDDDGWSDLAIGVPDDDIGDHVDAGSVAVLYGHEQGLSDAGGQNWTQDPLYGSNSEGQDRFGAALAVGDFDGDGYYDLAVGAPNEDIGPLIPNGGAVNIIYGSAGGLAATDSQYWSQEIAGVDGEPQNGDRFGYALAAGDFDGDGYDDLAIGVRDEDKGSTMNAGAVQVMMGSHNGITHVDDRIWQQEGAVAYSDHYGGTLATGDFDRDGYDDLAIGIKGEDVGSVVNAGAVEILYGSKDGLHRTLQNDLWHQNRAGIADTPEEHDQFGAALASCDFDGDGYDDLAVGVHLEDLGAAPLEDAGAAHVLYGSPSGITAAGSDFWHQDAIAFATPSEADDQFGHALVGGDFDDDGYCDLAVGVPFEDWSAVDTGIVHILRGAPNGLTSTGTQIWRQDSAGIDGREEEGDRFGYALAAGDFNGDWNVDLAIGVSHEAIGDEFQAGAVNVLYGSESGITAAGDELWYQGVPGVGGTPKIGDRFGYALAALPRPRWRVSLPVLMREYRP